MTMQIGRITGLNDPDTFSLDGRHGTLVANYKSASLADGLQRRAQLLGYGPENGDESVIPIVISGDDRLSGFWRVLGVHQNTDEYVRKQGNLYAYSLDLEQIPGWGTAMVESTLIGALVPNNFSVAVGTVQAWHAVPASMIDYYLSSAGFTPVRVAEDGSVNFNTFATTVFNVKTRGAQTPASFYQSAAQIQVGLTGSTIYPVVGQQQAPAIDDWRLTNGLTRVQSSPNHDGLQVQWYNGTSWGALKNFRLSYTNAGTLAEDPAIRIMRNDPCEVVVRVTFHPTGAPARYYGPVFLDVALRRGARVVRCYLTTSTADLWGLYAVGLPVSTAITAGCRQTTADADGNRIVLATSGKGGTQTPGTNTNIPPNASSTFFDFGIGAEVGTALQPDLAQDLVYQYLAGQAESQRVVVR